MFKKFTLLMALLCAFQFVRAQSQPDSLKKISPVRTISFDRYNAYSKGIDIDSMSYVGRLNHSPLPDKVLRFKKELSLTPDQVRKLEKIYTDMHMHQVQAGQSLVTNEKTLDDLFRTKKIDDGTLIFYTNRYGLYMGEMRNAVLQGCLATRNALTSQQISKFETLQKAN